MQDGCTPEIVAWPLFKVRFTGPSPLDFPADRSSYDSQPSFLTCESQAAQVCFVWSFGCFSLIDRLSWLQRGFSLRKLRARVGTNIDTPRLPRPNTSSNKTAQVGTNRPNTPPTTKHESYSCLAVDFFFKSWWGESVGGLP